jgi:hypothetical protein
VFALGIFSQVFHPVHDQTFFLDEEHKRKLKEEYRKYAGLLSVVS